MALPPSSELSRWTVNHVIDWLSKASLSAFRDDFLCESIDGSKLMRLKGSEIDQKYKNIPSKKRKILKDHLSRIESSRSAPSWSAAAPRLPPRITRAPAPLPSQGPDAGDESDEGGWSAEEFDSDEDYLEPASEAPPHHNLKPPAVQGHRVDRHEDSSDEDYLEPSSQPPPQFDSTPAGPRMNGQAQQYPQEPELSYEIPEEDLESIRQQQPQGLQRKPTMLDRLKSELANRQKDNTSEPVAPPRPPRGNRGNRAPADVSSPYPSAHSETDVRQSTASPVSHHAPITKALPPDDFYEIMNDVIPEKEKPSSAAGRNAAYSAPADEDLPPRPAKKTSTVHPPYPSLGGIQDEELPLRSAKKTSTSQPLLPPHGGFQGYSQQATSSASSQGEQDLSVHEWYHGKIGRDHAQRIFQREQHEGMFLIRKSERDPKQPYTLVIWHSNRIWNLPIRHKDTGKYAAGKCKQDELEFTSIVELVEHYKVVSINLKAEDSTKGSNTLTIPAPRH